ncbi:hypothetical protein CHS0354_033185 [Potamilus streckersoni]|uniref:Uncharacterized protein n=1 Tax=Potamilus streckersoni TaxID=2493646 RepID=A0AAE0VPR6_9BIVA|nr:hypothetical protein CHS0354_033185 [Potamilus streckersoni]
MVDFQVMSDLPELYSALIDFDVWADVLEERALSQDWCETKALAWNEKLQTRLNMAREEKMVLNILRKAFKKTRKTYIKAYGQTEDSRRMYKDVLIRLESKTGSKEVLKQVLIVKAKEAANRFVKALELEQTVKVKMITVMKKYDSVSKRVAVRKVQYFLDTWRTQLSLYIKHSFTSTEKYVGSPYLDAFVRVLGVNAHDAVEALFECNRRIFTTLQVNSLDEDSRNTDIGVDVRKVLGFEPKYHERVLLHEENSTNVNAQQYSGLPDSVFLPPGFKWHEVDQSTMQFQVTSSDLSTTLKQEVIVVHDHKASGKHELTCKKVRFLRREQDNAEDIPIDIHRFQKLFTMAEHRVVSRVAAGGFWSTPKTTYSQETQQLLKEMMKESRLTSTQQRNLEKSLCSGDSLPLHCPPANYVKKQPTQAAPLPKVLNPKNYHSAGLRKRETIEASGAYERPDYTPGSSYLARNSEKEKEKLANRMAFGTDIEPRKARHKPRPAVEEKEIDRFDEIQEEIAERKNFLKEMENLGQGSKYRPIIETEISGLIREMELIDKKRTAELEKLIAEEEKRKATNSA